MNEWMDGSMVEGKTSIYACVYATIRSSPIFMPAIVCGSLYGVVCEFSRLFWLMRWKDGWMES